MVVFMMLVVMVMVVVACGLGFAGSPGELVHQLDELIRRGMVFAGHVASRDGDGPIVQDGQLHFRFHG
jgi:hypothetical protein